MKSTKNAKSLLALAIASVPMAFAANAEEQAQSFMLEEIVVTAQKREESLSDVPIALSAFSDSFIKETKINDVKQLVRFTPGLSGESKDSFLDTLSVRGISTNSFGIGGDSSVGIYRDGVYYGRNGASMGSFYDVERVEVLKGPQGLLFGRNAASGAIHTITAKPAMDITEGYVRVGAGERGRLQTEFAYNQPLADGWAMRISGVHSEEEGFVENLYDGEDLIDHNRDALRVSIKNEGDWGDVTLTAEYEDREQSPTVYIGQDVNGNLISGDKRKANLDWEGKDEAEVTGVTLTANIDLSDEMTLTSITGYNKHKWSYAEDWDGTPLHIAGYTQEQSGEYFSQEVRLNVDFNDKLIGYIGASVYQENISALIRNQTGDLSWLFMVPGPLYLDETNNTEGDYSGWAIYGDMTYQLTEKMDISLGMRYTYDEKEVEVTTLGNGFLWDFITPTGIKSKQDWNDLSPRVNLRYFTDNGTMVFASVTEGYKAGGFGTDAITDFDPLSLGGSGLPGAGAEVPDYDPESVRSYEIGTKGDLADGRVKFGLSAYYYDYEDMQQTIAEPGTIRVENIGQVDGYGVELDLRAALNANWDVFLGVAWSETDADDIPLEVCAEISGSSCEGNRLPFNPEWSVSGGINTHYPMSGGEVFAGLDFSWQSETYSSLDNAKLARVDSAGFVNLRAGWNSDQDWSVSFYVENLFDKESFDASAYDGELGLHNKAGPSLPRTAGVDFTYNFSM